MGIYGVILFFAGSLVASAENDTSFIKKLTDPELIRQEYCRINTTSDTTSCGMFSREERLDVIYLPRSMAQKIVLHLADAFKKKYYFHLNKKDMFHGHLLARGPQTIYPSADDYFSDSHLMLYHSQEYLNNWETILGTNPFVPHEQQRSFVGWFRGSSVIPAIDLIDPRQQALAPQPENFLRLYKTQGTIYLNDLNQSLHESLHGNNEESIDRVDLFIQSQENPETKCRIFQEIYILEDSKGRFMSPDGVRMDVTMHCRYRGD